MLAKKLIAARYKTSLPIRKVANRRSIFKAIQVDKKIKAFITPSLNPKDIEKEYGFMSTYLGKMEGYIYLSNKSSIPQKNLEKIERISKEILKENLLSTWEDKYFK